MKLPNEITIRHFLMLCPVCKFDIVAKVAATIAAGEGTYSEERNVIDLPVTTTVTQFTVSHICTGPTASESADPS